MRCGRGVQMHVGNPGMLCLCLCLCLLAEGEVVRQTGMAEGDMACSIVAVRRVT